jgi:hypothetical protein
LIGISLALKEAVSFRFNNLILLEKMDLTVIKDKIKFSFGRKMVIDGDEHP